jgi:hypothetical protein
MNQVCYKTSLRVYCEKSACGRSGVIRLMVNLSAVSSKKFNRSFNALIRAEWRSRNEGGREGGRRRRRRRREAKRIIYKVQPWL